MVWLTCTVLMFSVSSLVFKFSVRTLRFWLDFRFYLGVSIFLGIDGYCSPCVEVVSHIFPWISFLFELLIYCVWALSSGENWNWFSGLDLTGLLHWYGIIEVVCFFFVLLVSAIFIICRWYSFYKNFMWAGPDVACTASRTGCPFFFLLKVVSTFYCFWLGFPCCWDLLFKV